MELDVSVEAEVMNFVPPTSSEMRLLDTPDNDDAPPAEVAGLGEALGCFSLLAGWRALLLSSLASTMPYGVII